MLGEIIRLLRPRQWYKNIVIFIALFFTGQFFLLYELKLTILGFISLCLISSANYVINDIIDKKVDRKHPEKINRPIASSKIRVWLAVIIALFLTIISIYLAYLLSINFMLVVTSIFLITLAYSFWLKNEPFIDIILISINFVLRAVSGAFIINVEISPWLIICAFFLSQFMGLGKRIFRFYSKQMLDGLIMSVMAVLIISYTFYTFLKSESNLIFTLPIVIYGIFRYYYLINTGSSIPRHPEKIFLDLRLMLSVLLWGLIVFLLLY